MTGVFFVPYLQISQSVWSPHTVERSLQDSCLAFLRSACTMASLCYDVNIPQVEVRPKRVDFSGVFNRMVVMKMDLKNLRTLIKNLV